MTERTVLVNNLQTNYKVFPARQSLGAGGGQGKPMVILHGWPSSSDKWQTVGELLAQKYLVIVPDLPGFGKSQALPSAWSIDNYVEWLNEFSRQIPELEKGFCLLGHSFGGAVAAKFAIKYNQKVEKLFLVSAACIRKYAKIKKVFYRVSKTLKVFSFLPYYGQARKAFYKFIIRKSDYPYQSGVMKETYLKIITDDLSYKVRFVKVPTVIIWGDKDTSTPIADGHVIHEKIKNSKLIIIPGADHLLHLKIPEILAQKVLESS